MRTVSTSTELVKNYYQKSTVNRRFWVLLVQAKKQIIDFVKFTYLVAVLVLLVVAVIEIKHIYNVDIFPGIDTPFDNLYYAEKERLGKGILKLMVQLFKS
ncbi:MAG: hypothetical protein ACK4K9_04245 [Bacteroidia bacterium]